MNQNYILIFPDTFMYEMIYILLYKLRQTLRVA